jgi:imidazolonepropionase-like amidohydrolase
MKTLLSILTLFFSICVFSQNLLIENVTIVDVKKGKTVPNQYILIKNGVIEKIGDTNKKPMLEMPSLDVAGNYVMPGMIDAHIHFFQTGSIYTRPDALDMTAVKSYEEELEFAEDMVPDSFNRYLRLGITSIMDVGGPFLNFKIRDSIASTTMSPNVFVTGPLFSPYQPEALANLEDVPIYKIASIEDATALFNKMLPYKPDFIKIWYIANADEPAEKNFPMVQHVAKMAHDNGLKLAVHATQKKTAELAIKAGADILVHSIDDEPADEAFAKLLLDNNVTYIPTLIVSKNYIKAFLGAPSDHPSDLYFSNPETYKSMRYFQKYDKENITANVKPIWAGKDRFITYYDSQIEKMAKSLKFLQDRGVNIVTGTDAGNIGTMHASSYIQEMEAMQKAGLTVPEVIKASTINAAEGFGLEKILGSIAEGKKADLLVLNDNPLESLKNLSSIEMTLKDGVVLKTSEIINETPSQIVQRQVNAYNARDIDAFLDTYSDDIKIYNFPEELSMDGKQAMQTAFSGMFKSIPNLYCEIKNRIVLGNKVVDREYVRMGENYSSVIAIYEVTEGKISKVTFLR